MNFFETIGKHSHGNELVASNFLSLLSTWTNVSSYPILTVNGSQSTGLSINQVNFPDKLLLIIVIPIPFFVYIMQQPFHKNSIVENPFWMIPITLTSNSTTGNKTSFWLTDKSVSINIQACIGTKWILLDQTKSGSKPGKNKLQIMYH